ncbi:hypothetical protein HK100_011184 [Physocladia obscura]|uniref:Atos-like conserved domain-containing protein n=1 Tax=Physocladia obscura TaxID=109957 RepID=A0AAD5T2J4_9FUNG|nr:hypothetical protein HK100_011184 [Physocladia obscura]
MPDARKGNNNHNHSTNNAQIQSDCNADTDKNNKTVDPACDNDSSQSLRLESEAALFGDKIVELVLRYRIRPNQSHSTSERINNANQLQSRNRKVLSKLRSDDAFFGQSMPLHVDILIGSILAERWVVSLSPTLQQSQSSTTEPAASAPATLTTSARRPSSELVLLVQALYSHIRLLPLHPLINPDSIPNCTPSNPNSDRASNSNPARISACVSTADGRRLFESDNFSHVLQKPHLSHPPLAFSPSAKLRAYSFKPARSQPFISLHLSLVYDAAVNQSYFNKLPIKQPDFSDSLTAPIAFSPNGINFSPSSSPTSPSSRCQSPSLLTRQVLDASPTSKLDENGVFASNTHQISTKLSNSLSDNEDESSETSNSAISIPQINRHHSDNLHRESSGSLSTQFASLIINTTKQPEISTPLRPHRYSSPFLHSYSSTPPAQHHFSTTPTLSGTPVSFLTPLEMLSGSLVGSYEESILNGRMSSLPSKPIPFTADISVIALGKIKNPALRAPKPLKMAFDACFYELGGRSGQLWMEREFEGVSPYVGNIDVEGLTGLIWEDKEDTEESINEDSRGEEYYGQEDSLNQEAEFRKNWIGGYRIPAKGQLQIIIKNSAQTAIKIFILPYDFRDMPPCTKTFLRQKVYVTKRTPAIATTNTEATIDHDALSAPKLPSVTTPSKQSSPPPPRDRLHDAIHLHFQCTARKRIYLTRTVRVVFGHRGIEADEKTHSVTEDPGVPKYMNIPASATPVVGYGCSAEAGAGEMKTVRLASSLLAMATTTTAVTTTKGVNGTHVSTGTSLNIFGTGEFLSVSPSRRSFGGVSFKIGCNDDTVKSMAGTVANVVVPRRSSLGVSMMNYAGVSLQDGRVDNSSPINGGNTGIHTGVGQRLPLSRRSSEGLRYSLVRHDSKDDSYDEEEEKEKESSATPLQEEHSVQCGGWKTMNQEKMNYQRPSAKTVPLQQNYTKEISKPLLARTNMWMLPLAAKSSLSIALSQSGSNSSSLNNSTASSGIVTPVYDSARSRCASSNNGESVAGSGLKKEVIGFEDTSFSGENRQIISTSNVCSSEEPSVSSGSGGDGLWSQGFRATPVFTQNITMNMFSCFIHRGSGTSTTDARSPGTVTIEAPIIAHIWPTCSFDAGVLDTLSIFHELEQPCHLYNNNEGTSNRSPFTCASCSHPKIVEVNKVLTVKGTSGTGILPLRLFDVEHFRVVETEHLCGECNKRAVNYVWGETESLNPIIPGAAWNMPIKSGLSKLAKFIYSAVHLFGARFLWLDVLCIPQNEFPNNEVSSMRFYYSNASACLVFLENIREGVIDWLVNSKAVEKVELADRHLSTMMFKFDELILTPSETKEIVENMSVLLENPCVDCSSISVDRLLSYSRLLNPRRLALKDSDGKVARCVKKLTELRALQDIKGSTGKMAVAELIAMTVERRASFLPDRIYGMLGMLSYGAEIKSESFDFKTATTDELSKYYRRAIYKLVKASVNNSDSSLLWFNGRSILGFLPDLDPGTTKQRAFVVDFAQLPLLQSPFPHSLSVTDDGLTSIRSFEAYSLRSYKYAAAGISKSNISLLVAIHHCIKELGLPSAETLFACGVPLSAEQTEISLLGLDRLAAFVSQSREQLSEKELETAYRNSGFFPLLDMCRIKLDKMIGLDTVIVGRATVLDENIIPQDVAIIFRVNCGDDLTGLGFWDISQMDFMGRHLVMVTRPVVGHEVGEERLERVGVVSPREFHYKWNQKSSKAIRIGWGSLKDV